MRNDNLEKIVQNKVYAYVEFSGGVSFSEIIRDTGINRGTTYYHLDLLEKQNMIESYKAFGRKLFFKKGYIYNEKYKAMIAASKNPVGKQIIVKIQSGQCKTNKDLKREIGVSAATVSWHIKRMKEMGIIKDSKEGYCIECEIINEHINLSERKDSVSEYGQK